MFLGTHTPRLDEKGRLFLPAKFRDELAEGLVVTKGQERCLSLFPLAEFERISGKLRAGAVTSKPMRDYSRVFFASAYDQMPDRQGRITVPPALRDYAGLDRDCVVTGMNNRVEILELRGLGALPDSGRARLRGTVRGGAARSVLSGRGLAVSAGPALLPHSSWRPFPGARPGRGEEPGSRRGGPTAGAARGGRLLS